MSIKKDLLIHLSDDLHAVSFVCARVYVRARARACVWVCAFLIFATTVFLQFVNSCSCTTGLSRLGCLFNALRFAVE